MRREDADGCGGGGDMLLTAPRESRPAHRSATSFAGHVLLRVARRPAPALRTVSLRFAGGCGGCAVNSVLAAAAKALHGERTTFAMHTLSQILFVTSVHRHGRRWKQHVRSALHPALCLQHSSLPACSYVFGGRAGVDKGDALNDLHW